MLWADYHRRQANTLVNLAILTDNRDTAISFMAVARCHAEKAKEAEQRFKQVLPEELGHSLAEVRV